jgi:hypothetical protein
MLYRLSGLTGSIPLAMKLVFDKVQVGYYYSDRWEVNRLLAVAGDGTWPDGRLRAWPSRKSALNLCRTIGKEGPALGLVGEKAAGANLLFPQTTPTRPSFPKCMDPQLRLFHPRGSSPAAWTALQFAQ